MLFPNVRFHISDSLGKHRQGQLAQLLESNGAKEVSRGEATHVITDTTEFEGWKEIPPATNIVTERWVERSLILGKMQEPRFFSADPKMIFSGVVACSTELESSDKEVIAAGIRALGGVFRDGLSRDCTHLFAPCSGSEKYTTALHHKASTGIKVVLPHWFDDCFHLLTRLDEEPYEWPDPRIWRDGDGVANAKHASLSAEKKALFKSAMLANNSSSPAKGGTPHPPVAREDLWNGRRILLCSDLELESGRRGSVELSIIRAGGVVVQVEEGEKDEDLVSDCDVFVARFRAGMAYAKALRASKTIGTLAWLFHVQRTGTIFNPLNQLLHYPLRKQPIDGFNNHILTVTNYTGEARDYIKRLIDTMGATFTPAMTVKNTVVIAAFISGTKTEKAREWSIPVVNHTWLEDCFVQWRNLTPAITKYIDFPTGINFATVIGERGIGRISETEADDVEKAEAQIRTVEFANSVAKNGLRPGQPLVDKGEAGSSLQPPPLTSNSTRDAREVEEAVSLDDVHGNAEPPEQNNGPPAKGKERSADEHDHEEEGAPLAKRRDAKGSGSRKAFEVTPRHRGGRGNSGAREPSEERDAARKKVTGMQKAIVLEDASEAESEVPTKKRKGKAKAQELADDDDSPPAKKAREGKARVVPMDDELDADERPRKPPGKAKSKAALWDEDDSSPVQRPTKGKAKPVRLDSSDDDEQPKKGKGKTSHPPKVQPQTLSTGPAPTTKKPRGKNLAILYEPLDSEDELSIHASPQKRQAQPKKAPPARQQARQGEDEPESGEDDDGEEVQSDAADESVMLKHTLVCRAPKLIGSKVDDDEQSAPRKPGRKGDNNAKKTAASTGPVKPAPKASGSTPKTAAENGLDRTTSINAVAADAPVSTPPLKRGRPAARASTSASRDESPAESAAVAPPAVSGRGLGPQRTPSRRNASSKATEKLRNEVMPDLNNFQREMRNNSIRGAWEEKGKRNGSDVVERGSEKRKSTSEGNKRRASGVSRVSADDEDDLPSKKRRRMSTPKEPGDSDQEDSHPTPLPMKIRKKKAAVPTPDSGDEDGAPKPLQGQKTTPGKSGNSQDTDATKDSKIVRIMPTGLTLDDQTLKALEKLGIKSTSKPAMCTHLIVKQISRTEKFLSAMSSAPFIVSELWIHDCLLERRIMPEKSYTLNDPVGEKKFKFKLSDALRRARDSKTKLLDGHTFYVTGKVGDVDLIKRLTASAGGKVVKQTPTARMLKDRTDRHVISCPADQSVWRVLAEQGFPIYTNELIYTGILVQRIDWDDNAFRVEGSGVF